MNYRGRWVYDYIRDLYSTSISRLWEDNMGVESDKAYKTRWAKSAEIRKLITTINALSAELKEEGWKVEFNGGKWGLIKDVKITKLNSI